MGDNEGLGFPDEVRFAHLEPAMSEQIVAGMVARRLEDDGPEPTGPEMLAVLRWVDTALTNGALAESVVGGNLWIDWRADEPNFRTSPEGKRRVEGMLESEPADLSDVLREAMRGIHARDGHVGFWEECPVDYCDIEGFDRGPLPSAPVRPEEPPE